MRLSCLLLQCALLVGNLTPVLWFSANKTGKKKSEKCPAKCTLWEMCDFCNNVKSNLNILRLQFSIPFMVMCWIPKVKLGKGMFQHVLFFLLTFFPFPGLQSAPLGWDQAWKVSAQMEAFEKVLNIWQWGYHGNLFLSFFPKYSHNSFHITENYTSAKFWKALSKIQNI